MVRITQLFDFKNFLEVSEVGPEKIPRLDRGVQLAFIPIEYLRLLCES
jgi:hypothetical protein